ARPAGPAPATPLLSVRRVPGWIRQAAAVERLGRSLGGVLRRAGASVSAHSCLVVTRGDATVFSSGATRPVIPASNLKLLTTTAVLERLGGALRLTTSVTPAAAPVGGTVAGNLYLVGGGDPFLYTAAFDRGLEPPEPLYTPLAVLAGRVRAAGVLRVTGGVVGDESLFDSQRGVPSWKPVYETEGDVGPLSALEVDEGFRPSPPYGPVAQPATYAASVFTSLLRADGVTVEAPASSGVSPAGAPTIASIRSAPLAAVVGQILRVSDDTGAELLTKLLGRRVSGVGSTAAGVAAVRSQLAADGLPVGQLHAVDGSGLSRSDRLTCDLIAAVLRHDGTRGAVFAGLPVAGRTGTLAGRMGGTPAAGRLHAKTGTLDGVAALSGFVLPGRGAPRGPPLVFALVLNDLPSQPGVSPFAAGVEIGDAVGEALAAYPVAPPLSAAAPLATSGAGAPP
ncbi:MAG: D-alanyl-D-alanine carboxypeptidase/D-alanyl-D-alanine endopeptidase, partial [Acidimicrobiales bacterium]